jgi:hypothetical protein
MTQRAAQKTPHGMLDKISLPPTLAREDAVSGEEANDPRELQQSNTDTLTQGE